MNENELSRVIVSAAIEVHSVLGGSGLLEDVYVESLCEELRLRGVLVQREVAVPIVYKGRQLQKLYRIDVLVGGLVLIEAKAVEAFNAIHLAQCLTHLRLTGMKLGMVINFGERLVKDGIHRVVNGL